ncbi:hypothetical protein ACJX0J_035144, partial [Zea mays]
MIKFPICRILRSNVLRYLVGAIAFVRHLAIGIRIIFLSPFFVIFSVYFYKNILEFSGVTFLTCDNFVNIDIYRL